VTMREIARCSIVVLALSVLAASATCPGQEVAGGSTSGKTASRGGKGSETHSTSLPSSTPTVVPGNDDYRIGVEDELQISVWHEPELSGGVAVRPDGMITLPLLNDIRVVGLTTKQLQNQLTEQLKPFVSEPQVTIIVRAIKSRKVYMAGKVVHPGAYGLNGDKTVLQMLLEAGGLTQFAKPNSIYVLRKMGDREERLAFSYKKALKGEEGKGDFPLCPGDMVVVP
jgi:polysaccharide biosynthesis/export protein